MKYAVNEEGVAALNASASGVEEAIDELNSIVETLSSITDEHSDTIGPHKASLDAALESIQQSTKQATDAVGVVAVKLREVASGYQEVISNDRISGTGGN